MKQIINKISIAAITLITSIGLPSAACSQHGQTSNQAGSNQTVFTQSTSNQTKEIEIPSGIEKTDYVKNPDESILFLTLNSNNQVYFQDKLLDDSTLKEVLKEYNEKHKNDPSTTNEKYPSIYDDKFKYFYLKADAGLPFSQILKVLKAVQESSATSYRAKFIVKPQEEIDEYERTPNGIYVVNIDLGIPTKIDENAPFPITNFLTLQINLMADGKVKINNELKERSEFPVYLKNIFRKREQNGVFKEGTMEIEKTIFLIPAPDAKYGDVIKFIDELKVIGANPIAFVDLVKGREDSGSGSGSTAPPPVKKP